MAASIYDHELPDLTHNLYDVTFHGDTIHTLVTNTALMADAWISQTENLRRGSNNNSLVGLDVEWKPNFQRNQDNLAATIQLCAGRRCLIFQLLRADSIPQSLTDFLMNVNYTFAGVGIETDIEKLLVDYDLNVARHVDLGTLAANDMNRPDLRNAGLKTLSLEVLGKELLKPKRVTISRWDNEWLTPQQVQYACIDAFVSFEIGRVLQALQDRIVSSRL